MNSIHFLHGFLGSPNDWSIFNDDLINHSFFFHSIADYMQPKKQNDKTHFDSWVNNFNSHISKEKNTKKNILVGYSLGGRLALHSLASSNFWNAAIIISANPGLINEHEKKIRIKTDNEWANRFKNEKWENVIKAWNSQSVFSNSQFSINRKENTFCKAEISKMLKNYSLGKQENLRNKIKLLNIPILWLAGEKDPKYVNIAYEMQELNKNIALQIIPNAGHRVPWENPQEFKSILHNFQV
ncbi:alpha/beta fold hydrolase [Pigmentibacter sp. JX0631]|uniref:alpha/beta fold hydrolase n=1 Tax=Pigmentibacter sp. JX0631 TaxID=2976982 RepID=UPI00246941C3|nr:alpha/beta fold hydrolase [Pigmentibacter sp. JX0631]WGL60498.1 alpha/beta fold hydrolase [Pigmentibacter sp. JX0631]